MKVSWKAAKPNRYPWALGTGCELTTCENQRNGCLVHEVTLATWTSVGGGGVCVCFYLRGDSTVALGAYRVYIRRPTQTSTVRIERHRESTDILTVSQYRDWIFVLLKQSIPASTKWCLQRSNCVLESPTDIWGTWEVSERWILSDSLIFINA